MIGKISEVFDSVQGEGLYLGQKQIFIRFFGCNLKCQFCDTKLDRFFEYEPHELLDEVKLYRDKYHSVSFTGGEPLLQNNFLKEMLQLTCGHGYKNYLETNGTLPGNLEEVIDNLHIVAMDVKLPSSTGMGDHWDTHRQFLRIASKKEVFLKTIICVSTKEEDLSQALAVIEEVNKSAILVLQPNSCENQEELVVKMERFKEICREKKITACVIPQMHKIMGIR